MKKNPKNLTKVRQRKLLSLGRKPKPIMMLVALLMVFMIYPASDVFSQSYPIEHQTWLQIAEADDQGLEASFMVSKCTASAKDSVFILIFNEKPQKDTTDISVKIFNAAGTDSVENKQTLELGIAEMIIPSCGVGANGNLKFPVPSGYDPKTLTVTVTFK